MHLKTAYLDKKTITLKLGKISCNNKISFSGFSIIMEIAGFELEVFKYGSCMHYLLICL